MDRLRVQDLAPSMRLDESLHLLSGELVLYRRQAVDELVLDALAASGVRDLALTAHPAEAEALALDADREAVPLENISEHTVFTWGLYDAAGRKVLSARRRLTPHRAWVLASSGVNVVLGPASDLAATVARRRRLLLRTRAPRPGRGPASLAAPVVTSRMIASGAMPRGKEGDAARSTLAMAVLASEAEALAKELVVGLSLDVPRALEAAHSAVDAAFAGRPESVACAVEMLSSGGLRERAAASAVIAVAAARSAGWREDECLELAAAALLCEAPCVRSVEEGRDADGGSVPDGEGTAGSRRARGRVPVRAHRLLADADGLAPAVALSALQVQERLDGSGRPFGLAAAEILPSARLLAAADEFCLSVSPPPAGRALSGHVALRGCVDLAGEGLLDGEAVRALLRAVGYYPVGSSVQLSTGEIATVVAATAVYDRPIVSVTQTPSGLPPAERRVMDLSRLGGIRITGAGPDGLRRAQSSRSTTQPGRPEQNGEARRDG